jgi:hypothetical protein
VVAVLLGVSASLALVSGALAVLELVKTQPLDRPTHYMTVAVATLVTSFAALSAAFVVLVTASLPVR